MAAITTHREEDEPHENDGGAEVQLGALARYTSLPGMHAEQLRTVWIRRTLEDALAERQFRVVEGASLGKDGAERHQLFFELDRPLTRDVVPWMPATMELESVALIGEAQKMGCPTWDLPAGAVAFGGACPGADAGQSTVPEDKRRARLRVIQQPVRLEETICETCYATGGNYASPHVQGGEIIRYYWCRQVDPGTFVETLVRAIQAERFPAENLIDPLTGRPVLPFRVHSSGDFFSHEYARSWLEVARRVPEVRFWAPTRTWAAGGWPAFWESADIPPNFTIRPSAYHTDDPSPSPRGGFTRVVNRRGQPEDRPNQPWAGAYGFNAEGSTSIYRFNNLGEGADPRYDWNCKTYSNVGKNAKTCALALSPEGTIGCRACWIRPDLRVNYTTH